MITTAFETATLGGGCFWGVEAVFRRLEGVGPHQDDYRRNPDAAYCRLVIAPKLKMLDQDARR